MGYSRRGRSGKGGLPINPSNPPSEEPKSIPFVQRLTCTINEAREVTGLGRTKLYELMGTGHLITTTVGRRRLVLVSSLQALVDVNPSEPGGMNGRPSVSVPIRQMAGGNSVERQPASHPTI